MQEVPFSSLTLMENCDETMKPAYKNQLNHHQKQENKKKDLLGTMGAKLN